VQPSPLSPVALVSTHARRSALERARNALHGGIIVRVCRRCVRPDDLAVVTQVFALSRRPRRFASQTSWSMLLREITQAGISNARTAKGRM